MKIFSILLKMGRNLVFGCVLGRILVESGTLQSHQNGSNDVSYSGSLSRDSNDIEAFQRVVSLSRKPV